MSSAFKPETTIISSDIPKETELNQSYAHTTWIQEKRQYWVTRGKYGYRTHMEVLANSGGWCYIYTYDSKMPTKTLKGAVKRIQVLVDRDTASQAKNSDGIL